jgi:rhamnosyltransferase
MKEFISSTAGMVILFNPSNDVFDNISSYINQIKRLYIVDNSTRYNYSLIQRLGQLESAIYINHQGNKGVATALNTGAELAIQDKFEFLLTMDQDTRLSANFVAELFEILSSDHPARIGIISPCHSKGSKKIAGKYQRVLYAMTSGNILNLKAYQKVGPFQNELFVDHVDHEYCLRLNEHDYWIMQNNLTEIVHRPGHIRAIKFFGRVLSFSSHPPVRLYYFFRNGVYISKIYGERFPEFKRLFRKLAFKEIAKIFMEKEKILRIRMVLKGLKDSELNKMGPYTES